MFQPGAFFMFEKAPAKGIFLCLMEEGLRKALERRAARVESLKAELDGLGAAKITFEIGCGKGHYLSAYGQANPGELCVGIDIISSRVRDGMRKNERRGNENVVFMKALCEEFLEAMPDGMKFGKIFIFFPDPWPKKRHFRRRLIQPEFLDALMPRCLPETRLYFRTDHDGYFEWAEGVFNAHPGWETLADNSLPFEEVSQFQRILPVFNTFAARLKSQ